MNEILSHARNYRDAHGFNVIPLRERSKTPKLQELLPYLTRKATDEEFEGFDWSGNVGIVTGPVSGLLVLDEDIPGTLEAKGWKVPRTPTAKTGKGKQFYFKHPDEEISTTIRLVEGLDVKAAGGYVVAPPSQHPNGDTYKWIVGLEDAPLAEVSRVATQGR